MIGEEGVLATAAHYFGELWEWLRGKFREVWLLIGDDMLSVIRWIDSNFVITYGTNAS